MRNSIPVFTLLLGLLSLPASAAEPDTLAVTTISRDTVDRTPSGWTEVLPPKARGYSSYTVRYDASGPYIHAAAHSTGSWIERDVGEIDISRHPVIEWDWETIRFPDVQWERNEKQDDFALRIELVFDYRGGKWNILHLLRKGLITTMFGGNPPVRVLSYVWSVEVPAEESYPSPGSDRVTIIPIESGIYMTRRWMHERRDVRADLARLLSGEPHIVLKKIRIRCDTDDSGSSAEGGVRNIRLIGEK